MRSSPPRFNKASSRPARKTTESKSMHVALSTDRKPMDESVSTSAPSNPEINLRSDDPVKIKDALARVNPETILKDLEGPVRPRWAEALEDWVEVHMPRSLFEPWELQQDDEKCTSYEYDALNERLGIRCVPSSIHNSAPRVFSKYGQREIGKLSAQGQAQLIIGPDTGTYSVTSLRGISLINGRFAEFDGFDFPGMKLNRTKEPDAYLSLEEGEFPLVVLEAGWSERKDKLIADAQLWLHGSHGTVAFVVIIVITEHKKHDNCAGADEKLSDGTIISGLEEDGSEASSTDVRALAETFEQLEKAGNLMKPLVGGVDARMCVYRRIRTDDPTRGATSSNRFDRDDLRIFLTHDTKVFPDADTTPVKLPWADILPQTSTKFTPEDRQKDFVLHPKDFHDAIEKARPHRIRRCARQRAVLLLQRQGRFQIGPTFDELKRGAVAVDEEFEDPSPKRKKRAL